MNITKTAILYLVASEGSDQSFSRQNRFNHLTYPTPSSPSYDRGVHFRCCTHQGCTKSKGIKLLVEDAYQDKTLPLTWRNCVMTAVKDEKIPKCWKKLLPASCLLLPLLFRKSGGKTVNDICIKKALDKSLVIFKQKGQDCCPRTGCHAGMARYASPYRCLCPGVQIVE